jgi:hypothetical protein
MGQFIYTPQEVTDEICKGNVNAALFIFAITSSLHLWDDLIDRDHAITDEEINQGFWNMLVAIPSNSFYLANLSTLQAILQLAIENWKAATEYERDPKAPTDLHAAFIIRSTYIDLVTTVARLCGGHLHACKIAKEAHRICHQEGFEGFLDELKKEKVARETGVPRDRFVERKEN